LLADPLEEIYIGDEITPRPKFVTNNMSLENKYAITKLFQDYVCDRISSEMRGLSSRT
jgi:hypothetical protein